MNVTNWLKKHQDILSIRGIETKLGCPSTLAKAISGERKLPKKWEKPLAELIAGMALK